jgi:DNA-binding LytR/AlgR family response regulator
MLIVTERSGRWAVALRRELSAAGLRLREARSLPECWDLLAETPEAFLVLELTAANAAPLVQRLAGVPRQFPAARAAVVAERGLAEFEVLVREAGAVHFVCSPRRLAPLAAAVRRHMVQLPPPPQGLAERIWAGLPWAAVDTRRNIK